MERTHTESPSSRALSHGSDHVPTRSGVAQRGLPGYSAAGECGARGGGGAPVLVGTRDDFGTGFAFAARRADGMGGGADGTGGGAEAGRNVGTTCSSMARMREGEKEGGGGGGGVLVAGRCVVL